MNKKVVSIIIVLVMCFSFSISVFAGEIQTDDNKNVVTISLDDMLVSLSADEYKAYSSFGVMLAQELANSKNEAFEKVIEDVCTAIHNPVFSKVNDLLKSARGKGTGIELMISPQLLERYRQEYVIDDNNVLVVTPSYIEVNELVIDKNNVVTNAEANGTSNTFGTCTATYYGILGNKLFSLAVECSFNYNGSSAWYRSDFDYYYTRGTLSIWQVSNWRGWKEASGTSYKAYCSGNFHWGAEYDGNGLVIQDYYCKNTLTCNKNGTISRSTICN